MCVVREKQSFFSLTQEQNVTASSKKTAHELATEFLEFVVLFEAQDELSSNKVVSFLNVVCVAKLPTTNRGGPSRFGVARGQARSWSTARAT